MKNKYKICYLETAAQIGGGQVGLFDILKNLDYSLFEPWVILSSKGSFFSKLQEFENVKTCLTPFIFLPRKISDNELIPIYSPFSVNMIRSKINEIRPDLFHSNHLNSGRYGAKAAYLNKIPNIVTFRCMYKRGKFYYNRFVERRIHAYADKIVFNSIRGAELLRGRIQSDKILSIVNGIDLSRFKRPSEVNVYKEYAIPENRKILLLPARIHPDKGHSILIKAASNLLSKHTNFHIVFLGSEDILNKGAKSQFNSEAISLGLQNNITWIDFVDNVVPFFKSAYCVVLPSFWEGCPRVLLEALAAGTPIIGSKIDGINEIVQEGVNGFGFILKDSDNLSFVLDKMFSLSLERYMDMKNNCLRIAEEQYDIRRMITSYQNLYLELINQAKKNNKK